MRHALRASSASPRLLVTGLVSLVGLAGVLGLAAPARADAPRSLLVTEAAGPDDMAPNARATLSRLIESEVRRAAPKLHVVTQKTVRESLDLVAARTCLGADDESCLAELAGAFGVDFVLSAHFGRMGSQGLLTLSVFRASDAAVLAQASRRMSADDEAALLDAVAPLVREVLAATGSELAPPPDAARAGDGSGTLSTALLVTGVGVGSAALLGGAIAHGIALAGYQARYDDGLMSREEARGWEKTAPLAYGLPFVAYAAGVVLITGGLAAGAWLE